MNATTIDVPEATLGLDTPAGGESRPARRRVTPELSSRAAQLLGPESNDRNGLKSRLAYGLWGLTALGLCPALLLLLAGNESAWTEWTQRGWLLSHTLGLPVAAALTFSVPLPGLLILLGMQDDHAEATTLVHALSRAFYRMGLLALGAGPILGLYALTGASERGITLWVSLSYLTSGGTALALLLRDIFAALSRQRARSLVLLLGWGAFVSLLGLYFHLKLSQLF